jgi:hypothetical protein
MGRVRHCALSQSYHEIFMSSRSIRKSNWNWSFPRSIRTINWRSYNPTSLQLLLLSLAARSWFEKLFVS